MWKLFVVAAVGIFVALLAVQPHSEDRLMGDWSSPPPWPIFIGVNVLAGVLRSAADALTPPPIRMLEMSMAYQNTLLAYTAQKFKIPDSLATGPKSAAEIAAFTQTKDVSRVERLLFAMAANGIFKLGAPAVDGTPLFVNSPMSAVLRSDHPNSMSGMLGHNVEDMFPAWASLPKMFGPNAIEQAWDTGHPDYPLEKGGIW